MSFMQVKKESFFTWRVELSKTEKYWEGWFRGLSALFLTCPVPKLLLLAGELSHRIYIVIIWKFEYMKRFTIGGFDGFLVSCPTSFAELVFPSHCTTVYNCWYSKTLLMYPALYIIYLAFLKNVCIKLAFILGAIYNVHQGCKEILSIYLFVCQDK